jgi:signal transduction histidine kinase
MFSGAVLLLATSAIALFMVLIITLAHTITKWVKLCLVSLLLCLMLWQITIFLADQAHGHLLFWNHLVFLWPTLAIASFYVFSSIFHPSAYQAKASTFISKMLTVLAWSSVASQLFIIGSHSIFSDVRLDTATHEYIFTRNSFYFIYLASLLVLLVVTVSKVVRSYLNSKKYSQQKQAFRSVLITVAIASVYGLFTNVILPNVTDSQQHISFGLVTIDILAVGFAFSMLRYQFLDIRAYVFRAGIYAITLIASALMYVGIASLLATYILKVSLTFNTVLILSAITLAIAASFQPLKDSFNHMTNRLFFRDYYDPQEVLDKLGDLLVRTVDVKEIQRESKKLLQDYLHPTFTHYLLIAEKNKDTTSLLSSLEQSQLNIIVAQELHNQGHNTLTSILKERDIAVAVRLRTTHEDLGFMILGYRQSGSIYSSADRKFLGLVSDQLAIGLQNALRFAEIEKFNLTLQQKIEEATIKLRKTNEKLRLMDQTKDDFISMSSHQLRTPLTSIKGYVSMVLDGDAGPLTSLQKKLLMQSFVSSQRMVYLISDLLNVSRLRTGKFVIDPVPTNLANVVRDEVEQLQETAKGRGLNLVYVKPSHFPIYMLDETKLRQVIMNFLDNAIYYTPPGGTVTAQLVEKPQSIEFTVLDDGIGVPKHEQHHLFSKFYRAHNAKRARPDGTGLGLYMAKKVIVAQGGAIIFRSHEGKGSTFGFTFAKAKVTAPSTTPAHAAGTKVIAK